MTASKPIIVIGAGTMGRGIAQVFAQSGYEVMVGKRDKADLAVGVVADEDGQLAAGGQHVATVAEERRVTI